MSLSTPSVALEIVQDLFEHQRIWVRVALAAKVAEVHRQRGGRPGRQDSLSIVKGVLGSLKKDGKVENFAFGRWRWIGPATSEQDSDTLGTHAIPLISSVALDIVEDLFQQRNTWSMLLLLLRSPGFIVSVPGSRADRALRT